MRKRLPPIEGLPEKAPACPYCGRKLKPWTDDTQTRVDRGDGYRIEVTARRFLRWSAYDGVFDRLRCARFFALAAYKAGYRLTGQRSGQ